MHFAVDSSCAWFELLLRAPIRREFARRFTQSAPLKNMGRTRPYLEIEETAANSHMLRQLTRFRSRRELRAIEDFVRTQPAGYREGLQATPDADFADSIAETLRSYLALWAIEYRLDLGSRALNFSQLLPLSNGDALAECPIYVIDDLAHVGIAAGSTKLILCIPNLIETDRFKKQLQHQPPTVKALWDRKKAEITHKVPRHPDFEKLKDRKPTTWSLRLNRSYRAHLQRPDEAWQAVAIGNHKEMGHG
jgi:hypothetical protein